VARSAYVYIVMAYKNPVAGFTVKHELERYLKDHLNALDFWRVWRLTDNPNSAFPKDPVQLQVDMTTGEIL
jgi:hypothetical protein